MREDFVYDRLNRLTGIVEDNDTTARFDYDAYGRMLRKYMHSALVFDSAAYNAGNRPHAIAQAQTPLDLPLHRMRYMHFDKLAFLMQDTLAVDYFYGYEHQRLHMTEASVYGDTLVEKEYVDNCEYIDNGLYTTTWTYLSGPLGVFGVQEQRDDHRPNRYFIHPDHLGSWTLVTDSYANIRQDVMYDAWGMPYGFDETDTTALVPVQSLLFDRGFTGHEHLLQFGLINMNGRMYDPFTSGFLSVDNYVQSPDYTQSFNRYAYCLNNPLKYTDPDGEFWHLIIGAAIGGIANLASNWGKIDTFGEGLAYFGIGAAAGALGAATGGAAAGAIKLGGFVSGAISGAVGGASSGMITGSGNAWMQGANFGQGLKAGAIAAGIGAGTGAVFGGLSRGIMDYRKGFNFWDGSTIDEFVSGETALDPVSRKYNSSLEAEMNDQFLSDRMLDEYGVKEGDYGIKKITTKVSRGYRLASDGRYINVKEGHSVGGYTRRFSTGFSEIHISPNYATTSSIVDFKAVVGHELIHAYHNNTILFKNSVYSERVAYKYTYDVYMNNHRYLDAAKVLSNSINNPIGCCWGSAPSYYWTHPFIP